MIELGVLGPHSIRDSDGRDVGALAASPKRFALLAYLAVHGNAELHRRDTLAAMFWPDMDQFSARRALRNTLYHLREALGDGVIITQGDDGVGIDPTRLTSDVSRLYSAVTEGRYEEAVDSYRGELLPGVHIANTNDAFEDWLSLERQRVLDVTMRAVRKLVDRERNAGNTTAAAYWAQRACALAPDDENWLRCAMSLLAASNDRGGALRLHERYTQRLAAEFDMAPSAETETMAQQIRLGVYAPAKQAQPLREEITFTTPAAAPQFNTTGAGNVAAPIAHRHAVSRRNKIWALGLSVVVATIVVVSVALRRTTGEAPRARALVAAFDNRTGDEHLQSLGRMAEDWITQGVIRAQLMDVVDPRVISVQGQAATDPIALAEKTGATIVVSGNYYQQRDSVLFEATVVDVKSHRVLQTIGPIVTSATEPVAALDALRSRVMTALAQAANVRLPHVAETNGDIPPYDVYESYLDGWDAFWHRDGERAERAFLYAAHHDTLFGAAAVAAATSASNFQNNCALVDSISREFANPSRILDRIDRYSLRIAVAHCRGQNEEMLRLTLERAELEPQTSSLRFSAAAAALWANRPAQTLAILQRINPKVDLGWNTDTANLSYFVSMTEAQHLLGQHDAELFTANQVSDATPLTREWLRGRALAATHHSADVLALVDSALTLPAEVTMNVGLAPFNDGRPQYASTAGWVTMWIARELAVHSDTSTSRLVAARTVAWYLGRTPDERMSPEERLIAAWAYEMVGSTSDAERLLRALVHEDSLNVDYRGELAGLAAKAGDVALADTIDHWLRAQPANRVSWSASYYRARAAALAGHQSEARLLVRDAMELGAWPMWLHNDPALSSLLSLRPINGTVASDSLTPAVRNGSRIRN